MKLGITAAMTLALAGCPSKKSDEASVAPPKKLYVSSGLCHAGLGITAYPAVAAAGVSTASRAITRWNSDNGSFIDTFLDLNQVTTFSAATFPQSALDSGDSILLLTENGTNFGDRQITRINKADTNVKSVYSADTNAFTNVAAHITRSMARDTDGTVIFSRSLFAERLSGTGTRITKGGAANPWINSAALTGTCFNAAAALISKVIIMPPFSTESNGKMIFAHSAATAVTNRIGIISSNGLTSGAAADCLAGVQISSTQHKDLDGTTNLPASGTPGGLNALGPAVTGMVYIPTPAPATTTGKLIVTYSAPVNTAFDNTTNINFAIVAWDVNETSASAATLVAPQVLYKNSAILVTPSTIAYDASTSSIFVGVGSAPGQVTQVANNAGFNIEKFTLNLSSAVPTLTRVAPTNSPFIVGTAQTRCISDIMIAD